MRKNTKRGFTIVELVIVIAVIGILSAVLIPTFAGLVNKANLSADEVLVRNINQQLEIVEVEDGKNATMYDALQDAQEAGYLVANINAKSKGNELVWDQTLDRFALIEKETGKVIAGEVANINNKLALWRISSTYSSADGYSIYLKNGYNGPANIENVSTGIDVGENTNVSSISYASSAGQTVTIRTNGGLLTVNAPSDTVNHYGEANIVDVQAVALSSYHEHEKATFIKLTQGRVVAYQRAEIGGVYVVANNVTVSVESSAELPDVTFASSVTSFKVQTTDAQGTMETESLVTVGTGVDVSDGENAVPNAVQVKLETANKAEKVATAEQAEEKAASEVLPSGVARIGAKGYETLDAAVQALQNGQTIVLLADIEKRSSGTQRENGFEISNGTKTLDLNGYTILVQNLDNGSAIKVNSDCVFNLLDSSANGTGKVIANRLQRSASAITVSGTVNIYGGDLYGYSNGVYANSNSVVNIYGGVFGAESTAPINMGGMDTTLYMEGGVVNSTTTHGIMTYNNASLNICGGEINVATASSVKAAIKVVNGCSVQLGGSLSVNAKRIFDLSITYGSTASVVINNGTYTIANDGEFANDPYSNKAYATLSIQGGTFNFEPSVTGYKSGSTIGTVTDNGDGTWTVSAQS